ncbi:nucleotidyltransferase, partial [Streptomyces sp. SID11233]|nr:nucleotidyltransferase [Streptomyces sp. SID11233]
RGIFLAPTPDFWRFEKPPTHVPGPAREQLSWELERACALALRGDPNVIEALNSPLVLGVEPVGAELLALRDAFLSRTVV